MIARNVGSVLGPCGLCLGIAVLGATTPTGGLIALVELVWALSAASCLHSAARTRGLERAIAVSACFVVVVVMVLVVAWSRLPPWMS